jgi:hypothetical protein
MRDQPKVASLLLLVLLAAAPAAATPVQITFHNGRASIRAKDAPLGVILAEWARAGRVAVVNAEKLPPTPLTIELSDVPERDALKTLLRATGGYLAVERTTSSVDASLFERIVIMPVSSTAGAAPATAAAAAPPPSTPPSPLDAPPAPAQVGPPDASGVSRILDANGEPVEDDQVDGPPAAVPPSQQPPPAAPASQGVAVPGMIVPAPPPPTQPPGAAAPPPDSPRPQER